MLFGLIEEQPIQQKCRDIQNLYIQNISEKTINNNPIEENTKSQFRYSQYKPSLSSYYYVLQQDSPNNFTIFVIIMLIFRTSKEKIPALLNLFLREYSESQIIYVKETQQSFRNIKEKNKAKKNSLSSKIDLYPKRAREIIDKPIVKQATGNIEKKSAHKESKICVKNEVLNSAVILRIQKDLYMQYFMQKKAVYQARQRQNIVIEHEIKIYSLFLRFI
ncbi:hypothetical protein ABPG72_005111 [Tetrahymena utriculariae]